MKAIRKILACIRKADQDFNLINEGDVIVVGISGGKDSISLFYLLNIYKKFSNMNFNIVPVHLDLGFPNSNTSELKDYFKSLGYDLVIEDARNVYPILKANQKEEKHLPCSICSRMKKAAINAFANKINANKVAFAHHADDAIETLFMNEIYGSRIATFSPKMHLEKADITFIRPFIYVREDDICKFIKEEKLKVFASSCPADKHTTREDIKIDLNKLYKKYPEAEYNFLTMLGNFESIDLWTTKYEYKIEGSDISLLPVDDKLKTIEMIKIRYEVFIKEQNIAFIDELDGIDNLVTSYLIKYKDKYIGTISYRKIKEREFKFHRFAILKEYRNKGIGSKVLNYLEKSLAKKYTPLKLVISAQMDKLDFYLKNNYTPIGEPYIEANIKHIEVFKTIRY